MIFAFAAKREGGTRRAEVIQRGKELARREAAGMRGKGWQAGGMRAAWLLRASLTPPRKVARRRCAREERRHAPYFAAAPKYSGYSRRKERVCVCVVVCV